MRRLVIGFLLLLYLLPSGGVSIRVHYCCGRIENISLFSWQEDECCCSNRAPSKGCCEDRQTVFQFADDQQHADQFRLACAQSPAIIAFKPEDASFSLFWKRQKAQNVYGNPNCHAPPLFLRHSHLLI